MNPERSLRRSANIFISYRREDSAGYTGRLFDRLSNRFPDRVFMDIDTIEPGVDFAEAIEKAVGCCEVLIVVIGREWLNVTEATGRRRLDNPEDFVRLEVAAALERNILVVPVLVEDASMPRPEDLPADLVKLARRSAIELSDARWAFDVDRLIGTIERVLQEKESPKPLPGPVAPSQPMLAWKLTRPRAWIALVLVLILAGWIGWRFVKQPTSQKTEEIAPSESPRFPAVTPETSPWGPGEAAVPVDSEYQPTPEKPIMAAQGIIYGVEDNGDLIWIRHDGRGDGTFRWSSREKVGEGWHFKQVFSGGDGIIYGVEDNGDLIWIRHDGRGDGTFRWSSREKVGEGWNFKQVFSGGDGIIYGVEDNGDLIWIRHDGRGDGTFRWSSRERVGEGWHFKQVFSGGDGIIYGVEDNGDLIWIRHDGRGDGTFRWSSREKVGEGWNFKQIFSG